MNALLELINNRRKLVGDVACLTASADCPRGLQHCS